MIQFLPYCYCIDQLTFLTKELRTAHKYLVENECRQGEDDLGNWEDGEEKRGWSVTNFIYTKILPRINLVQIPDTVRFLSIGLSHCTSSWEPKNWCFQTVVLEKTLESPLDCKEIKPVNPKGNQSWTFIGRTDTEEAPKLWPSDANSRFTGKDPDAGRDGRQEEKGMTEDEMIRWHHQLDGCEFEWTPGLGDERGGLACCNSWGCKESEMTEWLSLFSDNVSSS